MSSHRWGGTWEFDYLSRSWKCPTGRHLAERKPWGECDCARRGSEEAATKAALLRALERATARATGREIELPDNMTAEDVRRAVRDHVREVLRERLQRVASRGGGQARTLGNPAAYHWDGVTRAYRCPTGMHTAQHPIPRDPCPCVRRRAEFLQRHPAAVLKSYGQVLKDAIAGDGGEKRER